MSIVINSNSGTCEYFTLGRGWPCANIFGAFIQRPRRIDLFSLYVFSFRISDHVIVPHRTVFFKCSLMHVHPRACVCIINETTKGGLYWENKTYKVKRSIRNWTIEEGEGKCPWGIITRARACNLVPRAYGESSIRRYSMLPSIRTVPVSGHLKQKLNSWGALFSYR